MHEHAARHRFLAFGGGAGTARTHRCRLLIVRTRGRKRHRRDCLTGSLLGEPWGLLLPRCGRERRYRGGVIQWRRTVAPHGSFAVIRRLFSRNRTQGARNHVPPAALVRAALSFCSADNKSVDGARHRYVKQAPMLVLVLAPDAL